MKLFLINEVFDKPSLEDVDIHYGVSDSITYTFTDKDHDIKYSIKLVKNIFEYLGIPDDHIDIFNKFREENPRYLDGASIYLMWLHKDHIQPESFDETGIGNQWFVYGKLIACVQHYITKHKPILLYFSGSDDNMDLVYDKFIKMSQRLYPQDAYVPYADELYIRKEIYDILPLNNKMSSYLDARENNLNSVRRSKNNTRLYKMSRNSSDDNDNEDYSNPFQ